MLDSDCGFHTLCRFNGRIDSKTQGNFFFCDCSRSTSRKCDQNEPDAGEAMARHNGFSLVFVRDDNFTYIKYNIYIYIYSNI